MPRNRLRGRLMQTGEIVGLERLGNVELTKQLALILTQHGIGHQDKANRASIAQVLNILGQSLPVAAMEQGIEAHGIAMPSVRDLPFEYPATRIVQRMR